MTRNRIRGLKRVVLFSGLSGIILIVACCATLYTATGNRWNLAAIYNPASSHFHPAYRVYHNADDRSLLLVKLFPNELLFNQANVSGEFISQVSIQVQNYEIVNDKPVLSDSVTYRYQIRQENVGRRFLSQIPFKAELGKRYQLRIVARDLLRKDFNLKFIDVDKTNEFTDQNYNLLNEQGIPYFNNVIVPGVIYRIEHRNKSFDKLYIDYYYNNTPLPSPTFATSSDEMSYSTPDSVYILDYTPELLLTFGNEGLYHFRFDTNSADGLTLVNFGEDFPKIRTAREMIDPLAYITTSADYKELQAAENQKLTVDNFWLNIGKTTGRARELIRIYYNRVYFANYYFSTSKPGWKTDRGMVYIVYGPPQNMQKTANTETWIYYNKGASSSINLTFEYKPNAFSLDNFILRRSESHDWHWREAVDAWRDGEIFLMD